MKKMITFFIFIVFSAVLIYSYHKRKEISCKTEATFIKGKDRIDVVSIHTLIDGKGTISMSGVVYDGKIKAGYFSKIIGFSYKKNSDIYLFTSNIISTSPYTTLSPEFESKWFPLFFTTQGESLFWKITPAGEKAWLFYSKSVPVFICEKTR